MKIRLDEIKETEKDATFVEEVGEINDALSGTGMADYQFEGSVPVDVRYYRLGADLFFGGRFSGAVRGACARCLAEYSFPLRNDFAFVLKPALERAEDVELKVDDLSLSFYRGNEIDLSPLVREAMMLSLPTRPLCSEDCRGLCPRCGANRNLGACDCRDGWTNPRLEGLHKQARKR